VDFKAIAGWLGHKDGGVLAAKTYGHLRNEHSAAMAQRMTFDASEAGGIAQNIGSGTVLAASFRQKTSNTITS